MINVYFRKIESYSETELISCSAKELLATVVKNEKINLEKEIPLKVHFGEKGNTTFIEPKNYQGIIDFLKQKNIKSSFIETNALYRSERTTKDNHVKLAKEHGFTQLPIIIADGQIGNEYEKIQINKKHFKECKIAKEFSKYKQVIVLSHFKGHMMAGFGGAVKQLAMGFAARGGKLDQHSNAYPILNPLKCKKCRTCIQHCPANAILIKTIPRIDKKKCIGCASCIAVCPHNAIKINWFANIGKKFHEKLAEYAYAAQLGKNNIYINFALNITANCDCQGKPMRLITKDMGIFASTDPVAVDKACLDVMKKQKKEFRRIHTLDYGEKIGLGKKDYSLIELK